VPRTQRLGRAKRHRQTKGRGAVLDRVEDRHVVGGILRRTIERTIGIDRRMATVGRDQVMQIVLLGHPIA
jgi:hypothetical protein